MRLWSIHPEYLDSKGLVALWREALLAKKVLENKTKGYKNHSQLLRFKNQKRPVKLINFYLKEIYKESQKRDFNFDPGKIGPIKADKKIPVTDSQLKFEFKHLLKKLRKRDIALYNTLRFNKKIKLNPLFKKVTGPIEKWEKIKLL